MRTTVLVNMTTLIALFVWITSAQVKNVAIVEAEIDAQADESVKLTSTDVREITEELRREAVKNLPRDKYNIMTTETVIAQGGAVLEECSEENCVIILGNKIGADFIVRGTIRRTQTRFTLSVNMYETDDGFLVASSEAARSESIEGLIEKAAVVCAEMYRTFAASRNSLQKPTVTHTVAVNVNPAKGGTVSRNPDQTSYTPGTIMSVTAMPAKGYTFTGWSGASTSKNATLTGPINHDMTLTANFYKKNLSKPIASKPDADIEQDLSLKKRHTLRVVAIGTAISLDALGLLAFTYGYIENNNSVKQVSNNNGPEATRAAARRNAAYIVGGALLASGVVIHIVF